MALSGAWEDIARASPRWDAETKLRLASAVQRRTVELARDLGQWGARDGVREVAAIVAAAAPTSRPSVSPDVVGIRSYVDGLIARINALPADTTPAEHIRANVAQATRILETEGFKAYNGGRLAVEMALLAKGPGPGYAFPRYLRSMSGGTRRDWMPGIVVRWDALHDRRTCRRCREMDGKLRPLGAAFDGGPTPPEHPRCRCCAQHWPIAVPIS